jgi:hypothetical protein
MTALYRLAATSCKSRACSPALLPSQALQFVNSLPCVYRLRVGAHNVAIKPLSSLVSAVPRSQFLTPLSSTTTFIATRGVTTGSNPNSYPATDPTAPGPYPPSSVEAQYYYYRLPSQPRLVARSSSNVWVEPTGPEPYRDLLSKESSPIGLHPLRKVWEDVVGPAIIDYLDDKKVKWTSLDPVRMGYVGVSSPPVIVWIGVVPDSLSAKDGVEVATRCKDILTTHNINNVHIEIRESEVIYQHLVLFRPVRSKLAPRLRSILT